MVTHPGLRTFIGSSLLVLSGCVAGRQDGDEEAAVAAAVVRFHDALAAGDSTTALSFMAEDVAILEGGGLETLEQYRSGHLRGDIGFAMAVTREPGELHVTVSGDVAWVISTHVTQGMYRDREINSRGAELVVLSREGESWKIRAVHWSSGRRS